MRTTAPPYKHYCLSLRISGRFHLFDWVVPSMTLTRSSGRHIGGLISLITRHGLSSRRTVIS